MANTRFCLEIWGTDYKKIKEICLLAEQLGFYGFYYGESLSEVDLDCWTVTSNLSAVTRTIKLGPVITYILPQYRNISLLAKQALTVQEISNGRLEFRTGSGAALEWASQWWQPYGIDYPHNAERVSLLEEGVELLIMLWTNPSTTFEGRYFNVRNAALSRIQTTIPITIAAKNDRTMKIAAKYAHIWECSYLTPAQFVNLKENFETINRKTNRHSDKRIGKSIELDVVISESKSDLEYKKKILAMERGPAAANKMLKRGLVGTPETIRERIKQYTDVGVDQFLIALQDPLDIRALELFEGAMYR